MAGASRLFCGSWREQAPDGVEGLRLVVGGEVRDAALRRVDDRAAELLGIDLLVGDGLHDVRAR